MKKAAIFGATATGRRVYEETKEKYEIVAFFDENTDLHGDEIDGIEILSPEQIQNVKPDIILVAVLSRYEKIKRMLIDQGIEEEKINTQYVDLPNRARDNFVCNLREMFAERGKDGAVAELGVYQGEFSKVIGEYFSENKFYLFDTFEGFPEIDADYDVKEDMSPAQGGYFSNTSSELVLSKIINAERCVVCKGYFPDTARRFVEADDRFLFVNLDADLYQPTKEGLSFFFQRLLPGGVILVHDYFSAVYKGVKRAVDEFCAESKVMAVPIGDTLSIAIVKSEDYEHAS